MSPVGERENLYANLGPGLITGAADDDPSGIATYSQVGAQFGFAMLWTMLFSFPSMALLFGKFAHDWDESRHGSGRQSC